MTARPDFWSRRKALVEAETLAGETTKLPPDERTETEILAELGLPDPAMLTKGDDFAAFMCRTVPEALRRKALRQLWRSNPVLANTDGLVDYGADYTASGNLNGSVRTAYQVGKGLLRHVEALAMKAGNEPKTATVTDGEDEETPAIPDGPQVPETQTSLAPAATPGLRMRFKYDDVSREDT